MKWIINIGHMDEYSEQIVLIYEKFLVKILTNKLLKSLNTELIAIPQKKTTKLFFIKSSNDIASLKEKDFLFEGGYIYVILSTNIDINDGKTFKKVWELFPDLSSSIDNPINVYGNHFHSGGKDIYIENDLVVQGYQEGEFDEGYFSDDQSDDYFVSFADLPEPVQDTWSNSLN